MQHLRISILWNQSLHNSLKRLGVLPAEEENLRAVVMNTEDFVEPSLVIQRKILSDQSLHVLVEDEDRWLDDRVQQVWRQVVELNPKATRLYPQLLEQNVVYGGQVDSAIGVLCPEHMREKKDDKGLAEAGVASLVYNFGTCTSSL